MSENVVREVLRHDLCAGCGICQSIAGGDRVRVRLDGQGYLRPVIRGQIAPEALKVIADVCPGSRVVHACYDPQARVHPVWGPYLAMRTGYACDAETRFRGSSGGAVSALLIHLLRTGEIDYVVQIAAGADNPLVNAVRLSRTREQVMSCAGSRYAPSSPLTDIGRLLDEPGNFAFVGKPCDVSALRRYALHDPRVGRKVKTMISFMCAGVPSQNATEALVRKMGCDPQDVRSLRYRGDGWPGYARVVCKDGSEAKMSYEQSWGTILTHHLQFRCKICPDGVGEFADVVCADAWECDERGFPAFSEREGRSLIISRTSVGERIVQRCIADGELAVDAAPATPEMVRVMQPYQFYRKTVLAPRYLAIRLWGGVHPQVSFKSLLRASRCQPFPRHARNFLGMIKRLMMARLVRRRRIA